LFEEVAAHVADGPIALRASKSEGGITMVKRRTTGPAPVPHNDGIKPPARPRRPGLVQSSIYLPTAMRDALREVAFKERRSIHSIMLEGIRLALNKREQKVR
jgi:hypothetical protein